MTTETNDPAGAGSEIVAPESVETPEVTTPESNAEQPQQQEESKDDSENRRTQRRIDRLTKARYEAQAEARFWREQAEQLKQSSQPKTEEGQPQIRPEDIDRLATQRAQEIASAREMQSRVSSVLEKGSSIAGFDDLCNTVNEEVSFYEGGRPTPFLEAVLDSDKPHELLAYLGQNPDIAADLSGLSPARLGRRIEAIEREMKATKVSKAPAPLKPVTPKGTPASKSASDMTDAEFYAARVAERQKR